MKKKTRSQALKAPTKKRKSRYTDSSLTYSCLSWTELEPILPMEDFNLKASAVPENVVNELRDRLVLVRLYIEAVSFMLGDVTILVEESVNGKHVHVRSRFDFVLKRGRKRICIVEAKRDDIPQGIAQNVTGLEALSDVEGLEQTFGIVTNYIEWVYISDDDEKTRWRNGTLQTYGSVPTIKSLSNIVGMVHTLLVN
ncbi:unnamed protein product [Phytophthora lilii]|uniref:Unnamed protein product n=1 Tax=Phytophthora lilii TaxID=2077276 RepID=A0A9W6TV34_9STRA|nr:unnamed protein product [Phytophthora lilii]